MRITPGENTCAHYYMNDVSGFSIKIICFDNHKRPMGLMELRNS